MLTFCWVSSLTKPPVTEALLLAVSDVLADWYTSASYWERPDSAMLWWRKCETACLCTCAVVSVRESTVWVFWVANKFLFITNIPEKSVRIVWNQTPIVLKALHQAEPISPSVNLIVKCVKGYRGGKKRNRGWCESSCSIICQNHLPGFLPSPPSLPTGLSFWKNHQNTFPRNSKVLLKFP